MKATRSKMPLFTFYLDYRGGTYISQLRARDYMTAPAAWAKKLDLSQIPNASERFRENLLKSLEFEKPVPLNGVNSTWCCALIYASRAILHFTQTAETRTQARRAQ